MRALADRRYTVHLLDCRGHGQSGGKRAHVDRFDEYLSDLDVFLSRVRERSGSAPLFLLGHSHGALIAVRYLLDHPDAVRGAVLASPYFRLKLPVSPIKILAGKLISRVFPSLPMRNELKQGPRLLTPIRGINDKVHLPAGLLATIHTPVYFLWGDGDPMGGPATAG